MAGSLKLMALFGILHGLAEWGFVFIPIQAQYLTSRNITWLIALDMLITALSFTFLFYFGVDLISKLNTRLKWLGMVPGIVFGIWFANFILFRFLIGGNDLKWWLNTSEIWSRYLLAIPGSLLTAYALAAQIPQLHELQLRRASGHLRGASYVYIVYAVFAGIIVPPSSFFPANFINTDKFFALTGLPVPVFRALCGLAMAYFMIRILEIFDLETKQRLEAARERELLYAERERISRDLHDGTLQSIYAAGLALENAYLLIDEDRDRLRKAIELTMNHLNNTIKDIRCHISNLNPAPKTEQGLFDAVAAMVGELRTNCGIEAVFELRGKPTGQLKPTQISHLFYIIKEAITNIQKHSAARSARIILLLSENQLYLEISDDGIGIPEKLQESAEGEGHGLTNIQTRVQLLGGTVRIRSGEFAGTSIVIEMPYCS